MESLDAQFDIEITEDANFLFLPVKGDYSLLKANNLFKFAVDSCLSRSKCKILIDITGVKGSIPFFDRFQYSEFLSNYIKKCALGKVNKMAVLGREPIVDKNKFGETVAINRGANVRVFTDKPEAWAWINEK